MNPTPTDDTTALVAQLAQALMQRGWGLVTAESCTGGLISAACTELAGEWVFPGCGVDFLGRADGHSLSGGTAEDEFSGGVGDGIFLDGAARESEEPKSYEAAVVETDNVNLSVIFGTGKLDSESLQLECFRFNLVFGAFLVSKCISHEFHGVGTGCQAQV